MRAGPSTLSDTHADAPAIPVNAGDRSLRLGALFALLSRVFGADLRSLAALRIALGTIILVDLLGRWSEIRVHYTDAGLFPREQAIDNLNPWRWSVFLFNGTEVYARLVFLVAIAAAIAVILGYRTRLATIALWMVLISLQARNPLVLSAADAFLRMLLFWGMFLPLGAAWSLDRRLGRQSDPTGTWVASVATAALFLQIAFVYLFTAMLKTGDAWRSDFTAIWYALGAGQLTTPFGAWLHQFPGPLRVLTVAALATEVVAPLLLFIPWRNTLMRLIGIGLIAGLQVGILLTMNLGLFPWISTFCMVCFLPTAAWDWLGRRVVPRLEAAVAITSARLPRLDRRLSFAAISPAGPLPPEPVASGPPLPLPAPARADPLPRRSLVTSLLANVTAAVLLLGILGWNIATVSSYAMPDAARPVVYGLGLYQRWSMFAPKPPGSTQWTVIQGTLENGERVSLLEPLVHDDMDLVIPATWDRPANIGADYYGSKEWRKYFDAVNEESGESERRLLGSHLCRQWNEEHTGDMRLISVVLYTVSEATLPDGETGEQRQVRRATMDCD